MLSKQVFPIEISFAIGARREVATPIPQLEVDVVDVALPLVLGGEGLRASRKGEQAAERPMGGRWGAGRVESGGCVVYCNCTSG